MNKLKIFLRSSLLIVLLLLGLAAQENSPDQSARIKLQIQKIEENLPQLDRGAALFGLARLYAQTGDLDKALALTTDAVATGEGFDPAASGMLRPLRSKPEFAALAEKAHQQLPVVHKSRIAFTVHENDLFPEGLAYDPARRVLYMGSMHRRKIIRITEGGEVSDFVKPDLYHLQPIGGVHVDPADQSLWAASDPDADHDSELYHFDAHGKLLERYSLPGAGPHDLNDLVLYRSSAIFTTDTETHQVFRFDRKTHSFTSLTFPRPLLYPNGITLSSDSTRLYIADWLGVLVMDLRDNSAREVDPGGHNTLAGVDGLYWYKNSLVGVQTGTAAPRVVRWRLSPDGGRVIDTKVLEQGTSLVSDPTTGAIRGRGFYYIANTGIANYDDGKIVDPAKLEPVHIAVAPLV